MTALTRLSKLVRIKALLPQPSTDRFLVLLLPLYVQGGSKFDTIGTQGEREGEREGVEIEKFGGEEIVCV